MKSIHEGLDKPELCRKEENLWVHVATNKIYIPEDLRHRILFYFHFSRIGVHRGAQKMISQLTRYFYWPSLAKDCVKFTTECLTCQRRLNISRKLGSGTLLSTNINILVSIDTIGPFYHDGAAYKLFTMIDHLSKWAEVSMHQNSLTSEDVWMSFFENWIARWGAPKELLSDNDSILVSPLLNNKTKSFGITGITCAPAHKEGNGVIEGFHHYLMTALNRTNAVTNWTFREILASVLFAYRSMPHVATGETPSKLMTGCDMIMPHWQQWTEYEELDHSRASHRYDLITNLRAEALSAAVQRLTCTNVKADQRQLKVDDIVLVAYNEYDTRKLRRYFGNLKLAPKWSEPFRITKALNAACTSFVAQSIWHQGLTRRLHQSQVHVFRPSPEVAYQEWYRREEANDQRCHAPGSMLETMTETSSTPKPKRTYKRKASSLSQPIKPKRIYTKRLCGKEDPRSSIQECETVSESLPEEIITREESLTSEYGNLWEIPESQLLPSGMAPKAYHVSSATQVRRNYGFALLENFEH